MKILTFKSDAPDFDELIAQSVAALRSGALVGMPTETVYGLAGDATRGETVARIFEMKQRPSFNPLIAHVSGLEMAETIGIFDEASRALAAKFWPGPLTLVVPQKPASPVHDLVSAGLPTIAIRCPGGDARSLIAAFGGPLAAPSANRSGRVSPTSAAHVCEEFAESELLILDGGECEVGLESTIARIDADAVTVLRAGAIGVEEIGAIMDIPVNFAQKDAALVAPGMMASHYAPRSQVVLNCHTTRKNAALLGFGPHLENADLNLSAAGDLREAASNLYGYLRQLDEMGKPTICIAPIPKHGLGIAINDRIARAAAPRGSTSGKTL